LTRRPRTKGGEKSYANIRESTEPRQGIITLLRDGRGVLLKGGVVTCGHGEVKKRMGLGLLFGETEQLHLSSARTKKKNRG